LRLATGGKNTKAAGHTCAATARVDGLSYLALMRKL